jgi:hypothetical protein
MRPASPLGRQPTTDKSQDQKHGRREGYIKLAWK